MHKDYRMAVLVPLKYIARGGDAMATVTFSDLIQFGMLIVGIIALCKKSSK